MLSRIKNIPSLKELVAERRRGIDEDEIKARFMAHNERLKASQKDDHG